MSGFINGLNRFQTILFPESLDDYVEEDNLVHIIDAFVDSLNLTELKSKSIPSNTGLPCYHPVSINNPAASFLA